MKFKEFMDLGIGTEDGVLITKYLVNIARSSLDNARSVKEEFETHGYSLKVVPGEFLKVLTMNEKEIAELSKVLTEIDERGLKEIFQANLRPASFKRGFLERVKFCVANDFQFYNEEDHAFIKELYRGEEFAEYTSHKPITSIKTAQELDQIGIHMEDPLADLDPEDRQVYNQVVERLNYLILENPTNAYLPQLVSNATQKLVGALKRKEYRFLSLSEVVLGVMFDGIDVTPEMESVHDLVASAFPEEDKDLNEGRGLA